MRVKIFLQRRVHFIQRHTVRHRVKAVKSGVSVKQSNIGVAVASIWFIGGKPKINSIVRNKLV